MGKRLAALLTGVLLLATAACGNSTTTDNGNASGGGNPGGSAAGPGTTVSAADLTKNIPSTQPGVTDTEIQVGGIASITNPLSEDYAQVFKGAQAYFDMVNSQGGIYGRKLVLNEQLDDQTAKNQDQAQTLISGGKDFAILPVATLLFTGADALGDSKIPTFGWNINTEWAGKPNLFGEKGSYICADCAYPLHPWMAKDLNYKNIGVLAYGVPQSTQCADGIKKEFDDWPTAKVAFSDTAVPFGSTDLSSQVSRMKDANVDFIITCMDINGATTLAREQQKQGLKAAQYLPNGYDPELVAKYSDVLEGSYVGIGFAPFETPQPPQGVQDYLNWIGKVDGGKKNEISVAGWLNADLLYQGLKTAGPEFTQQSVTDAINQMTNWTANGITPGVDWTVAHDKDTDVGCTALVKIQGGKFVPQFGQPGKPFICLDHTQKTLPDQPQVK
jgi:branched-chain amino acid transport system substrate-binding protein